MRARWGERSTSRERSQRGPARDRSPSRAARAARSGGAGARAGTASDGEGGHRGHFLAQGVRPAKGSRARRDPAREPRKRRGRQRREGRRGARSEAPGPGRRRMRRPGNWPGSEHRQDSPRGFTARALAARSGPRGGSCVAPLAPRRASLQASRRASPVLPLPPSLAPAGRARRVLPCSPAPMSEPTQAPEHFRRHPGLQRGREPAHPARRAAPRARRGRADAGRSSWWTTAAPTAPPSASAPRPPREPRIRPVLLAANGGQSAALAAGFAQVRGRIVVTLDADLQNDPADLPRLLAALEGADVVSGIRAHRQDSAVRLISSRIANGFRRCGARRPGHRHRLLVQGLPARGARGPAHVRGRAPLPARAVRVPRRAAGRGRAGRTAPGAWACRSTAWATGSGAGCTTSWACAGSSPGSCATACATTRAEAPAGRVASGLGRARPQKDVAGPAGAGL